jgi:hypothetical protein
MVEYNGILGPLQGSVVLDASGNGTVRFAPAGEQWSVTGVSVSASSNTKEATATMYKDYIGQQYRIAGTYAGSTGDTNDLSTPIPFVDGQPLYVQWIGGDVGATATAIVYGYKTVVNRGFRAGYYHGV